MKNRASSHLLLILIILVLEIMGYLAVHRGGLLRLLEALGDAPPQPRHAHAGLALGGRARGGRRHDLRRR